MNAAGAVSCCLEACMKKKGSQLLHLCCHPGVLAQSSASDSVTLGKVRSTDHWSKKNLTQREKGSGCMCPASHTLHVESWISSIMWRWGGWEKVCGCCFWLELVTCIWIYILRHLYYFWDPNCPLQACLYTAALPNTETFQCFMFLPPFEVSSCREPRAFIMGVGVASLFVFLWFFPSGDQTQKCNRKVVDLRLIGNDSLTTSAHFPGSLFARLTKTAE